MFKIDVCKVCGVNCFWINGIDGELAEKEVCSPECLAQLSSSPTKRAADLATALAQDEDWLNEKMCAACGHSESRHNTAGGFCKHCTCNEFVEPATPPNR